MAASRDKAAEASKVTAADTQPAESTNKNKAPLRYLAVDDPDVAEGSEKPAPAKKRKTNDHETVPGTPADPLVNLQEEVTTTLAMVIESRTREFPGYDEPAARSIARLLFLYHTWLIASLRHVFREENQTLRASKDAFTGALIAAFRKGDANEMLAALEQFHIDSAKHESNSLEALDDGGVLDVIETITELLSEAREQVLLKSKQKVGNGMGVNRAQRQEPGMSRT